MESPPGKELVGGSVYEFHKPEDGQRIEVEVVFMHGLQLGAFESAYYETWRTRDGKEVWAETWLKEEYKNARILSLCYDSSARKTSAAGNMSPFTLSESLLGDMVSSGANIGQNGCPVIFVCHSLGGLIAKEIIVRCGAKRDEKYAKLLRNVKAFFFYATPHHGSDMADWLGTAAKYWPGVNSSTLVEYLKPKNAVRSQTHAEFLNTLEGRDCKFYVVAEGQKTTKSYHGIKSPSKWIVPENSARFPGPSDHSKLSNADHITVCKPENRSDAGYLKLIDCIRDVKEKYLSRVDVPLSVDPIGIEGKIVEIQSDLEIPGVSVRGLFGMGGIGKTTLSKVFYNRKARDYFKSCYLEDVATKRIQDVQKELLQELCGEKLEPQDRVEKRHLNMIKECLMEHRVLVVIDDVASKDYLKEMQVFHALDSGSDFKCKVVVTSRDKGILPDRYVTSGKAIIKSMDGIKDEVGSDKKLFSGYAFAAVREEARQSVESKFNVKTDKIVELCNGLPLSLEVIGTYLGDQYDEDHETWMDTWNEAYDRLHKAQSINGSENDKLWASLRISYDSLSGDIEKRMFLECACIFSEQSDRNVDKELCERIWDSKTGVKHLMNRHLLKIGKDWRGRDRFVMHDQLRDMGRMIGRKGLSKDDPGVYLGWWTDGIIELCESDKNNKSITKVLGLSFDDPRGQTNYSQETSVQSSCDYSQTRLLRFRDCHTPLVDDCLSKCSSELRWLSLEGSRLTQIGIQNIGSFTGLRVLKISRDYNMVEIPTGIGNLTNLRVIVLSRCSRLRSLPDRIDKLKKLEELYVCDCDEFRTFPDAVGDLSALRILSLWWCKNFQSLPNTIGNVKKLQELTVVDCRKLQAIPDTVGELSELRELSLIGCYELESLPNTLGSLRKLQTLNIATSLQLQAIPDAVGESSELRELSLFGFSILQSLPDTRRNWEFPKIYRFRRDNQSGKMVPDVLHIDMHYDDMEWYVNMYNFTYGRV